MMAKKWELLDDEGTVRIVAVDGSFLSNQAAGGYVLEQAVMGSVDAREALAAMVNSWAGDLLKLKDGEIKYEDQRLPGAVGLMMDVVGRHGKFEDIGRVTIRIVGGGELTRHILRVFEDGIEVDGDIFEGSTFIPLHAIAYIAYPEKANV